MAHGIRNKKLLLTGLLILGLSVYFFSFSEAPVDFNTEIKPLLNKKCLSCHGGVKRQGGFSLLFRQHALAPTDSGRPALIPGDPDGSEMIRRLSVHDPEERMPYGEEPLSKEEIRLLRRWVREGARWGDHWAFVPLQKGEVPKPKRGGLLGWLRREKKTPARSEIDLFIQDKLRDLDLDLSPRADAATLLRRVSLDLIGLPAPDSLAESFLADPSEKAYARLVDSLLASPHYGERWAALWLDLARYADTKGYERDDGRNIWRYRDWLIEAFNKDMPYDQFLTEQLAGDLLPKPTDAQYIATAFHRNTMTNDEGGTDREEFRIAAVLDRVNTTWEVLMGTTFSCVQCHSHPYDPFLHEEYYEFMAFFNNTRDEDCFAEYPLLYEYQGDDSLKLEEIKAWLSKNAGEKEAQATYTFLKTRQPAINSHRSDQFVRSELIDTKWLGLRPQAQCRIPNVNLSGRSNLIYRHQNWGGAGVWEIRLDRPDGPLLARRAFSQKTTDWQLDQIALIPTSGVHDLYFTYHNPGLDPEYYGLTFDWFAFREDFPGAGRPGYEQAKQQFWRLLTQGQARTTPILVENPADLQRPTHVFERGNWLVKGPEVKPDVPGSLPPLPKGAPRNRLGLAQWMASDQNPLVARTIVNRLWEQFFGQGLAETIEDLGTQGIPPTHRELLDWLSWRLIHEHNWSLKKLMRELVLSATYTQDSRATPAMLEKDPFNKYYARGARVRLTAEQLRDQALVASGLFSPKMYGPSVFPPQPPGIWMSPWNGLDWVKSEGEDQYRRAVYTYWKRSSPYPSMLTFDGVSREVCSSRRIRTNTPLQALTTLNDEAFVEMARHLAFRVVQEEGRTPAEQIGRAYQLACGRPISAEKLKVLEQLYHKTLPVFQADQEKTCEMVAGWDHYIRPEVAALVVVSNALMNLDEVITKN